MISNNNLNRQLIHRQNKQYNDCFINHAFTSKKNNTIKRIGVYLCHLKCNMTFKTIINILKFNFFFFLHVHTRGRREIQTSGLHFIKCGPNRLSYFLRTIKI
jgi:hypothetical protein